MSLYKKRRDPELTDTANILTILVGVVVIAIILALLVRLQRGLLGIILGSLAAILALYWIMELRKTLKRELRIKPFETKGWSPDIIEDRNEILIVGKVPGPEDKINIQLRENFLEVKGGLDFREVIKLPARAVSFNVAYNNGILEVRLRK
ncbi:hypothetical protein MUP59_05665 [Candidatus Bathyarchaeota archaeon]|nr:hypothetical protein [Candidatus Bathyarchaeota archaeon]